MKMLYRFFLAVTGAVSLLFFSLTVMGRFVKGRVSCWWSVCSMKITRLLVAFLVIAVAGYLSAIAFEIYDDHYGRSSWNDEMFADGLVLHSFNDGKFRVYNLKSGMYTTPKLNWISDISGDDTTAVYAIPHKRGYVDAVSGEILIDASMNDYTSAWIFSEGLAAVVKDGKIGFINKDNEVVIPFQFDYSSRVEYLNIGYLFHNGYCVMTEPSGLLGVIDKQGNWIVEPVYDQIWAPQDQGYRVIIKNGKYGLLDENLEIVYDTVYDYVGNFSENGGIILMKDGRMWQEDYDGNIVEPFLYESVEYLYYPRESDNENDRACLSDFMKYYVAGKYGIVNRKNGKVMTSAIYDSVDMVSATVFEVKNGDNYGYHFLML